MPELLYSVAPLALGAVASSPVSGASALVEEPDMTVAEQVAASGDTDARIAKPGGTRALKQKPTKARKRAGKRGKSARKTDTAADPLKIPHVPRVKVPPFEPSQELLAERKDVALLIRKNADNTFEIGRALSDLQGKLPEKAWSKFIKPLGLATRSAWNYMSVARNLTSYRKELIDADIGPTALYQLARGPEDVVQTVIDAYVAGERLGVAAIKRLVDNALGIVAKAKPAVLDDGGIAGLRRAALEKLKTDEAALRTLAKQLLEVVSEAAKTLASGKSLPKGALTAGVKSDAVWAGKYLDTLLEPTDWRLRNTSATSWHTARSVLTALSNPSGWPKKQDFEPWLRETVIPALRFMVHGDPLRPGAADVTDVPQDDHPIDAHASIVEPDAVYKTDIDYHADHDSDEPPAADPEALAAAVYASRPLPFGGIEALLEERRAERDASFARLFAGVDLGDDDDEPAVANQERAPEPIG